MCAAAVPACAEPNILISDEYRIMRDGEVLEFQQGYEITLKGFGADTVLIEFRSNYSAPLPMGNVMLKEGETARCYRVLDSGRTEILMLTLDKLYLNNSQAIVGFSHIYQFEETDTNYTEETVWAFETAVLDNPSIPQKPTAPDKDSDIRQGEPLNIIMVISLAAAALILIIVIFRKRTQKNERRK